NSLSRIMCCSYTLDYAYNDFCAALMAKELGTQTDYEKYLARSANWQNLWNPNLSYGSYTGFIGPKNRAGGWIGIDSVTRDWGSWQNYFYEASSYNYSFYVPHDPEKLIELCGGMDAFCDRLLDGINNGFVDFGNEPAFLSAFMYAYTDQPYLMTDCVQKVRGGFSINGNPGNDDSGALSSWYIFTTMGLYPCAGQDFYFLTSPWVDSTTIFLENGKELTITAKNLSSTNKYIQSVKINGMEYKKTTLPHSLIAGGAEIEFTMGPWRVDYTVMSGSADLCTVTFNTGSGSKVRERLVEKDSLLTRPDDPKRPGFEFSGWYKEAACTNPWNFAADKVTASITLYAKWSLPAGVTGAVEFVRMESIPNQSKNIVSETKYLSWAYLGRNDPVVKAGDTFFTSKVTATNGDLRQENLQTYHPESPYFSWTGGSPTAAGTDVRDILWSAEGLSFDITLPAGNYEVGLIVSGIRAGALVEVHTAAGAAILEKSMWGYTGGRTYQRVFLSFDCAEAGKYTVRLMVDRSGQLDNNHSVSVFGATVEAK
ncbi:MAG: glycoside hydrolase family 92 protein, partial [Oscillospiraceae bacterium]|nr:glycoside hydrolase family 92 protein [Oscillospiraceae bacterium]